MIDWEKLVAPESPPKSELLWAMGLGLGIAGVLITDPISALVGDSSSSIGLVAALVLFAFVSLRIAKPVGGIFALLAVLLAWRLGLGLPSSWLPESFQGLAPQSITEAGEGFRLILLRVFYLAIPVGVVALLATGHEDSRRQLKENLKWGDWHAGIRWPLPWWGVPPMPIWMFVLIGAPCAIPSFLPLIDWSATGDRLGELSLWTVALIPFIALINAFLEEFIFRIGLLAALRKHISLESAAIPTALFFGFVHFHGGFPGGWFGSLMLSGGGFMLGYLIIAQKGWTAAVLWHAFMDVIVLVFVFK
ncbi:MAG: lysostaphin resistance A-like protein [Aureliella sp.]